VEEKSYTMMRLLKTKELRMPLMITVCLQIIQQLSGINAIFFYSSSIFSNAGVPQIAIQYAVMGTCFINVVMTIVALPLMDRAGRRPLLLYPMMAMIVILGVIIAALRFQSEVKAMSYVSIACVISYVMCCAVGLGPIPNILSAEMFRQGPRPCAMSLGGLGNWLFSLVVGISFELIQRAIDEFVFLIFLILMIGFTTFVFFLVPETKNKTFEEISSAFRTGSKIAVTVLETDDKTDIQNINKNGAVDQSDIGLFSGRVSDAARDRYLESKNG